MEPIPTPVRRRMIAMYRAGESTEEIAATHGYCVSGVRRVRQKLEQTGTLEPRNGKVGRKPKLDAAALGRLAAEVRRRPDATLAELREHVGVTADLAVYCRELKKLGLTRKKSRSTPPSNGVRTWQRRGPAGTTT